MPAASPLFVLLFGSQEGYPERLKLKECLQQVLCFPTPFACGQGIFFVVGLQVVFRWSVNGLQMVFINGLQMVLEWSSEMLFTLFPNGLCLQMLFRGSLNGLQVVFKWSSNGLQMVFEWSSDGL